MFHDTAGHEELTDRIIGCGIRVHESFGPGLLESVYKPCLVIQLKEAGFQVDTTRRIPLVYRGHDIGVISVRSDHQDTVIVELKAVEADARPQDPTD